MPDEHPEAGQKLRFSDPGRTSFRRLFGSRRFWQQRTLHPIARILLLAAVTVLLCIAIGFIVAAGRFARADLLTLMLYVAIAAFAWHPLTAAFMVIVICSLGAVLTGSGGDLVELAIALGLVAATCAPWLIVLHALVLSVLTADIAINGSSLTDGGVYGITGIAAIAFLAGLTFRIVTAREEIVVAERARVVKDLEALAREEQERIADELHDGIAHDLTLVLFHARALPRQPDEASRQVSLTTIEESAEKALQSIQSLLSLMRETRPEGADGCPARYDGDVIEAVTSLATLLKEAGIPTRVSLPQGALSVTPAAERALADTAIEAVTNILKHGPNSEAASLDVVGKPGFVELLVTNVVSDADARTKARSSGRGLLRARQRLAQYGGELETDLSSGTWLLWARIPVAHTDPGVRVAA
ncbi:Sensor histidine kinase DesK [Microbacterium azadirachtae]|uniref:histidine kinase n=1 Tax=Microbacterium azadirachtae TaxID=582680 RepID=A0A0F0L6I5_9MICO|nr:histidine kinase [Microbacterium azadirachtae]KJL27166.1 Sensor histidine kinase DesK [Microbacterium azadirachtae]